MESDPGDPAALLAEANRAGAAPYIDYPPTPAWYPLAAGLWAGALTLTMTGAWRRTWIFVPAIVVLIMIEFAAIGWYRRYRGTMPRLTGAPAEIAAAFRRFIVGFVFLLAATAVGFVLGGPIVATAICFVIVCVGLFLYERDYARAAARTRSRLQSS